MKNIIIILIILFSSCSAEHVQNIPVITTHEQAHALIVQEKYSDPGVFLGTDFISFMRALSRTQKYDLMLSFTDSTSIKTHGEANVMKFYESTGIFEKVKNLKSVKDGRLVFTSSGINKTVYVFNTTVENDSCKLILPKNLNDLGK